MNAIGILTMNATGVQCLCGCLKGFFLLIALNDSYLPLTFMQWFTASANGGDRILEPFWFRQNMKKA